MLTILDSHIANQYDFFYMPVDIETNCNLGFGYVSVTSSDSLLHLYKCVRINGGFESSWITNDGQIRQVPKYVKCFMHECK